VSFNFEGAKMSVFSSLFGGKKAEAAFNSEPEAVSETPARPYRVLHANLPFYSDPECRTEVTGARLVVLRCEDPAQELRPIECMPTRKHYLQGQIVNWGIDHKRLCEIAWYRDPETGATEKAWAQAVEYTGKVIRLGGGKD
jgi:hypothetical protein